MKLATVVLILFVNSSFALAARLHNEHIFYPFMIPTPPNIQKDEPLLRLKKYLNSNEEIGKIEMGWTEQLPQINRPGYLLIVKLAVAEQLRPVVSAWGYELVGNFQPPADPRLQDPEVIAIFDEANQILKDSAVRFTKASSVNALRMEVQRMTNDLRAWRVQLLDSELNDVPVFNERLPYYEGAIFIQKELEVIKNAVDALAALNRDRIIQVLVDEIIAQIPGLTGILRTERTGAKVSPVMKQKILNMDLPFWRQFGNQTEGNSEYVNSVLLQIDHVRNTSSSMLSLEARVSTIGLLIEPFMQRGDVLEYFNPETIELMDYGLLRVIETIETLRDEDGSLIFRRTDLIDVLNRTLVSDQWVRTTETIGPESLKLLNKLKTYNGLIPYLRLIIDAKLAKVHNAPPSSEAVANYGKLPFSLAIEPKRAGERSRPYVHLGPLFSPDSELQRTSARVGINLVEDWLRGHRIILYDWSRVNGVPMDVLRSNLLRQRDVDLDSHQILAPAKIPTLETLQRELQEPQVCRDILQSRNDGGEL